MVEKIDITAALIAFVICFFGGVVRGYAGFGYSLASAPLLSLWFSPLWVVPAMMFHAVIGGLQMFVKVKKEVDWQALRWLLIGSISGMPLGLMLLKTLEPETIKIAISICVLLAVLGLSFKFKWKKNPPKFLTIVAGLISGMLNTSTSLDGPPVIIYFLAAPEAEKVGRASLIAFFMINAVLGVGLAAFYGVMVKDAWLLAAAGAPGILLGNLVGDFGFRHSQGKGYREAALILLAIIAVITLARAV